ncbi:hypothetical protein C5167_007799 [Papaver somniferum]|nr:hypothetical protein C5167_007799 [Papaver somniferum]
MEKYIISTILVTLFFFCKHAVANEAGPTTKHYVVYMGEHSSLYSDSVISSNHELLASVAGSISQAEEATTHHYYKSFRGFSAFLTPKQAQKLRETESVISVFENKSAKLHTTHSWEFLGIDTIPQNNEQTKMDPKADVIVGVFDTGVWPESQSFSDDGLGPVPERFKGTCGDQADAPLFPCNKKIIGARFYPKTYDDLVNSGEVNPLRAEFRSPLDHNGHGTHTASTIAGSVVNNVSYFGMASGTARGGIPNARLAIYKVCWPLPVGCPYADILSAFDDAIQDGVDIISMSIGIAPSNSLKLLSDPFTIGSIHAFTNNILLSASGGNDGKSSSVSHIAPWTLTVAASTINRELNSNVQLGNNVTLKGSAINSLQMDKYYGIIDATAAASDVNQVERAKYIFPSTC